MPVEDIFLFNKVKSIAFLPLLVALAPLWILALAFYQGRLQRVFRFSRNAPGIVLTILSLFAVGFFLFSFSLDPLGFEVFLLLFAYSLLMLFAVFDPTVALALIILNIFIRSWEIFPECEYLLLLIRFSFVLWLLSLTLRFLKQDTLSSHKFSTLFSLLASKVISQFSKNDKEWFLLFGIVLSFFFSAFFSANINDSMEVFSDAFLKSVAIYLCFLLTQLNLEDYRFLLKTTLVSLFVLSLISLTSFWTPDLTATSLVSTGVDEAKERLMSFGILANSNDVAAVLVIGVGFVLGAVGTKKFAVDLSHVCSFLALLAMVFCIVASRSRGGLLAVMMIFLAYVYIQWPRYRKFFLIFVPLVFFVFVRFGAHFLGRESSDLQGSSSSRLNYLYTGLNMLKSYPFFGVGLGRYPSEFENFALEIVHEWGKRTAHSSWILVLSETGIFGFIPFLALFYHYFKKAWRARNQELGLFLGFLGYFITFSFLSHAYLPYIYLLYGLIHFPQRALSDGLSASLTPCLSNQSPI